MEPGSPEHTGARVRPASSAPARPAGGAAPILWTGRPRRPASAANPATWPRHKLEGVLDGSGVAHLHCTDQSSLVEMVVMCVRDIASAGARYDLERLRDLQASEVAAQARETAAPRLRDPDGTAHADSKNRDKALSSSAVPCPRRALPVGSPQFSADNAAQSRGSTAAGPLQAGGDDVGQWCGGEVSMHHGLGGRGSAREMAAMARSGQVEELARSISMAEPAQATRDRCAEIRREREQLLAREDDLFHHALFERERGRQRGRQRDTALAILETSRDAESPPPPPPPPRIEGTRGRPSLPHASPAQQLTARQLSRTGAVHMQHGAANPLRSSSPGVASAGADGGSFLASGGGCGRGGSLPGASAAMTCATWLQHAAARRDELDPLLGATAASLRPSRSRAPLVLKVAAGKDRTLHE